MTNTSSNIHKTWLIVGATRGIGLEYVTQLLSQGHRVLATARNIQTCVSLHNLKSHVGDRLSILQCDLISSHSIHELQAAIRKLIKDGHLSEIHTAVFNAGILEYPGRISEIVYDDFAKHMNTNCVGPLTCAAATLTLAADLEISIPNIVFISSDSGSAAKFRAFEDGFGAYSASKAALNQGLRHLAAEQVHLYGEDKASTILAIHPGEVSTDMAANVEVEWEVQGIITPDESVRKMLEVIGKKGKGCAEEIKGRATFWDWEGREYPW